MRRVFVAPIAILIILTFSNSVFAQSKSREELQRELEAKRAELASIEKQILAPSETDRAGFADGSVIIAWKLLKKYSAPELVQNNP